MPSAKTVSTSDGPIRASASARANRERQGFRGVGPAVAVHGMRRLPRGKGGGVAGDLGEGGRPTFPSVREFLHDEHRTALARQVTACGPVERQIRPWPHRATQSNPTDLAHQSVRAERRLGAPAHQDRASAPDRPPPSAIASSPPACSATHHAARAAHPVPDGDLAGVDRVEPGDGLVGADVPRPCAPELLQISRWPNSSAAGGAGGHRRPCRTQASSAGFTPASASARLGGRAAPSWVHPVGLRRQPAGIVPSAGRSRRPRRPAGPGTGRRRTG